MPDKIITFENHDNVPSRAQPIIVDELSLWFLCEQDLVLLIEKYWGQTV